MRICKLSEHDFHTPPNMVVEYICKVPTFPYIMSARYSDDVWDKVYTDKTRQTPSYCFWIVPGSLERIYHV